VNNLEEEKVKGLISTGNCELIETHISWLLLGNENAYKIKKPVKFSFLDFSSLQKRKFFCEEEIRLNRRLAPEVYLDLSKITTYRGNVTIDGAGNTMDYAVKMKRLDSSKKMDKLLVAGQVSQSDVEKIAEMIAEFHSKTDTIMDGQYGSPKMVGKHIADLSNFREQIQDGCGLGREMDFVLGRSADFIERNKGLVESRKMAGKVKDCHGDLHCGNIFFDDGIKIIDCIEFSKDFRCIDTANEIAFMAMDLDAFDREDLSRAFVSKYVEKSGDGELPNLLNLFKCYRANVRAKIAAIEWMQNENEDSEQRMAKYIKLAERYATEL